jgi:hypothetical protein
MRILLSALTLCAAIAMIAGDVRPSAAQYHPYCALDSSSGATSCYYDTRCSHCISNPAYAGPEGAARARDSYRAPRR